MKRLFTTLACTTAGISLFVLLLAGCRKKADVEDTGFGSDHALLEKAFGDVQSIADQAGTSGSLSTFRQGATILSNCATVTNDTLSSPHLLTIDFGSTNCLGQDGNYRRGQILVSYTGRYKDPGHTHTITFNNYFVNDNQVTGTKTVAHTGNNAQGQPVYAITVNGAIILANGNGTVSWTSTRTRTWTAGYNTSTWQDDTYEITGSGSVTRANGKTFTLNIVTPLHSALNCRWIQSGVVQITPQGGTVRTLDYGNGTCDAQADYTVNGKTRSITLR